MKKSLFAMALGATLLFACTKPETELPKEEQNNVDKPTPDPPGPEPENTLEKGYIHTFDETGEKLSSYKLESSACITNDGYILFYASDIAGLTAEDYKNGLHENASVLVAGMIIPSCNGKDIDLLSSGSRFQYAVKFPGLEVETLSLEHNKAILSGKMNVKADLENLSASMESTCNLANGMTVSFSVDGPYAPGGEVYNTISFADWGTCLLRTAFYQEREKDGYEPILLFTPPLFEYADELPTAIFYAKLDAASELFDGKYHNIQDLDKTGKFSLQVWHGEPKKDEEHWDIVKGEIMMEKHADHSYTVNVAGASTDALSGRMPFDMAFTGDLLDGSIRKPLPDNKFTVDKKDEHIIGSVVIDLTSEENDANVYMCEQSGVKTVSGMLEHNPLQIRVSKSFVDYLAGLSTDPLLRITYNGREWSLAAGCEVGSYICDELNYETGWYSLKIRNFGSITVDYNGYVTILK